MKDMKELKKKLHVLHELHGDLSLFVVPPRAAWMLLINRFMALLYAKCQRFTSIQNQS